MSPQSYFSSCCTKFPPLQLSEEVVLQGFIIFLCLWHSHRSCAWVPTLCLIAGCSGFTPDQCAGVFPPETV